MERILILIFLTILCTEQTYAKILEPVVTISGRITESSVNQTIEDIYERIDSGTDRIVIVFDTNGGSVQDIQLLVKIIKNLEVEVYAYVREALSSSIFMVAACDRIVTDAEGVIGGGSLSRDFQVLEWDLRKEIRQHYVRYLESIVDVENLDYEVYKSMIDPEFVFTRNGKLWKNAGSWLFLTPTEMVELGMSEGLYSSVSEFIEYLNKSDANKALGENSEQLRSSESSS